MLGVARAAATRASSGGVAFGKDGAPSFSTFDTTVSTTDHTHTFGANSDAFTIMFGGELGTGLTITSVVIDPAGSNIPCALLRDAADTIQRIWAYEAHGFSGVSGAKTIRITWGSGSAGDEGRIQAQSYTNAADAAPTPTDEGAAASGTSIGLSLAAPAADGILQWGLVVNSDQAVTPVGFTETDENQSGTVALWTSQYGEKVGSLTSPETPSASWSASNRNAAVTFVVNKAGQGGAVVTPEILGTVTTNAENAVAHTTDSFSHTVTGGTDRMLLILLYGPDDVEVGGETTPSSNIDGNFTSLLPAPFGGGATVGKPTVGVWMLPSVTSGAHTITYGRALGLTYSGAVVINLNLIDVGDMVGDSENIRVVTSSSVVSSTLTTEKSLSLIIAWSTWQGDDALPITENNGLTQIAEFATGPSTTNSGSISVATKIGPESPGSVAYGFTASTSDDHCYGAIEIRGV